MIELFTANTPNGKKISIMLEEIGFEFQYEIGMKLQKYIGLDTERIYNRYYDEDRKKYVKVEPILKFVKIK